jgi:transposase
VPVKTVEQRAILAVHSVRALLVKQQTMLSNAVRGLAAEFGLIVPKGINKLIELMALVDADESVPKQAHQAARNCLTSVRPWESALRHPKRKSLFMRGRTKQPAGWPRSRVLGRSRHPLSPRR